jgi:hypothetical protein
MLRFGANVRNDNRHRKLPLVRLKTKCSDHLL